jgi:hypothetical protein
VGSDIKTAADFTENAAMTRLFDRSRLTFYSAEGLKELARDQMADATYFEGLLDDFCDSLYHTYSVSTQSSLRRLQNTVQAAQLLPLGGHVLGVHATPNDREGVCHHMANEGRVEWCQK